MILFFLPSLLSCQTSELLLRKETSGRVTGPHSSAHLLRASEQQVRSGRNKNKRGRALSLQAFINDFGFVCRQKRGLVRSRTVLPVNMEVQRRALLRIRLICDLLRRICKTAKATVGFVMSVCPSA